MSAKQNAKILDGIHEWEATEVDDNDEAYLKLKGAREKLCLAQMHLPDADDRQEIERAIQRIDSVGSRCCPAWSVYDQTHKGY